MRLPPLPTIGDVIRLYKISAAKNLAQNFIMDMSLNNKIVKLAGNIDGHCVCEVGPGPGGITRAILNQNVKHLYVIEIDRRFLPGLQMLADASGRLTAYQGDVLRFNMDNLFPDEFAKEWLDDPPNLHIIGNLPFNVATPLIINYMNSISTKTGAWRYGRTKLTLTFQKEVAERMVAGVNHLERCRLSAIVQNYCHVKLKTIIPGKAFVPAPEVDVGLVHFVPRKYPQIDLPFKLIVKVQRHLFHYRQKYCKHSLRTLFPADREDLVEKLLNDAEINPEMRSYQFTMSDMKRLCYAYNNICQRLPFIFNYEYRLPKSQKDYKLVRELEISLVQLDMSNDFPDEQLKDEDMIISESDKNEGTCQTMN